MAYEGMVTVRSRQNDRPHTVRPPEGRQSRSEGLSPGSRPFPMTSTQSTARIANNPADSQTSAAGVTHVRHRHDSRFTVVGNHLAQHPTLSATAIGIAVRIQSLPDGTRVGVKALAAHFSEGEQRIAAALRELEEAGYLERRKERTPEARIVTRTTYHECPHAADAAPEPARTHRPPRPTPQRPTPPLPAPHRPAPVARPRPTTTPTPRLDHPVDPQLQSRATDLLAGLRTADPRLLLSARDIAELAPAVCTWLQRGVPPEHVTRTLTAGLPPEPLHRPAGLLAHRLTNWLPPPLPSKAAQPPPPPLQTCDGCDRAFRARRPGRCRDCRGEIGRTRTGARERRVESRSVRPHGDRRS